MIRRSKKKIPGKKISSKDIPKSIYMYRTMRGWKQTDMANITGIPIEKIKAYEAGKEEPSRDDMTKLGLPFS